MRRVARRLALDVLGRAIPGVTISIQDQAAETVVEQLAETELARG